MKNPFKMLLELVAKEKTDMGAIPLSQSISLMDKFGKLAEKLGFDCYIKGEKKEVLDYKPTGDQYILKTLDDVAMNLTEEQFEMFIDDFRNFMKCRKNMELLESKFGGAIKVEKGVGFTWIDSGKHEANVDIHIQSSNKL